MSDAIDLTRKVHELTVLEFQDIQDAIANDRALRKKAPPPETINIANRFCDITVAELLTVLTKPLPRRGS